MRAFHPVLISLLVVVIVVVVVVVVSFLIVVVVVVVVVVDPQCLRESIDRPVSSTEDYSATFRKGTCSLVAV